MDKPMCELCGEQEATCQAMFCALCDDCFSSQCREALDMFMGVSCCNVWRQENGYLAICLAPYGVEHDHG